MSGHMLHVSTLPVLTFTGLFLTFLSACVVHTARSTDVHYPNVAE